MIPYWKAIHADALRAPRTPQEREMVTILDTLGRLGRLHEGLSARYEDDYVLGESIAYTRNAVVELANAGRALLNGELGRMDGASLDTLLRAAMEQVGVDPDDV